MKTCPNCNNIYSDDSLNFCVVDGATLTLVSNSSPNIPFYVHTSDSPETEILTQSLNVPNLYSSSKSQSITSSSFLPISPSVSQNFSPSPSNNAKRSYKYLTIIIGAVICGVIGGLLIATSWSK